MVRYSLVWLGIFSSVEVPSRQARLGQVSLGYIRLGVVRSELSTKIFPSFLSSSQLKGPFLSGILRTSWTLVIELCA
jgi:hypothetical protein